MSRNWKEIWVQGLFVKMGNNIANLSTANVLWIKYRKEQCFFFFNAGEGLKFLSRRGEQNPRGGGGLRQGQGILDRVKATVIEGKPGKYRYNLLMDLEGKIAGSFLTAFILLSVKNEKYVG